jgi:hypothetical protein
MTQIVNKDAEAGEGRGRIRRALPALGLIAAAVSGYMSQSGGPGAVTLPVPAAPISGPEVIAQEVTLLHFARAQGIGDAIRETGVAFPDPINARLGEIRDIVQEGRTEVTAYKVDMAYSAGYLDGLEGSWDLNRLDRYTETIFQVEKGILELSDQATLRWSARLGDHDAAGLVSGAMAITVAGIAHEPIWTGPITAGTERGDLFFEVSAATRLMLAELHDAAYIPPPLLSVSDPAPVTQDPFQDLPVAGVCAVEI